METGVHLADESLAFDSSGTPSIAYTGWDVSDPNVTIFETYFAQRNGPDDWTPQTVESGCGNPPSLAIDSLDTPHIAFQCGGVRLARWNGATWEIEVVTNLGGFRNTISLALDLTDVPSLSYGQARNSDLLFAIKSP